MRTRRGWQGLAIRWTPWSNQSDVEEPVPVLNVGTDEDDDAVLWYGQANGSAPSPAVGLRGRVDLFVVGIAVSGAPGPPPGTAVNVEVIRNENTAALEAAAFSQRFLRSGFNPTSSPASFLAWPSAIDGPVLLECAGGSPAAQDWLMFGGAGLLLRVGETLWIADAVPTAGLTLHAAWRGSAA